MLLCCFDEKRWNAIPEPQREGIMREYGELMKSLDESGRHLVSGKLQSTSTAATVRGRNGQLFVTDGPYAETKEQLGGYHLIECRDLDEAISLAKRIPTIPYGGAVEVRPLIEDPRRENVASV
jgi:hypothetical protein